MVQVCTDWPAPAQGIVRKQPEAAQVLAELAHMPTEPDRTQLGRRHDHLDLPVGFGLLVGLDLVYFGPVPVYCGHVRGHAGYPRCHDCGDCFRRGNNRDHAPAPEAARRGLAVLAVGGEGGSEEGQGLGGGESEGGQERCRPGGEWDSARPSLLRVIEVRVLCVCRADSAFQK